MTNERFLVCDDKDWQGLNADQRDWMIFKTLRSMDTRLKTLELWNKFFSFIGGCIGGAMAAVGLKFLG